MVAERATDCGPVPDVRAPSVIVLFVNGFHRSGTTLLATAATEATGGVTLTVGDLARHLPALRYFLRVERRNNRTPDRGVDDLPVTESTPEEYGWLLRRLTGHSALSARAARTGVLSRLVDELAEASGASVVVLKNPPDTGHERLLLRYVPGARVLLVRRELGAMEASLRRAVSRTAESSGYPYALVGSRRDAGPFRLQLRPTGRWVALRLMRWRTRVRVIRLAHSASRLPRDRVAFLSYDELRQEPAAAARWAAHLVAPGPLSQSVAALALPDQSGPQRGSWLVRLIDAYWARAWRRAREAQVRAGLLPPGGAPATGRAE
jgi:Sulfotransferase family